MSTVIKRGFKFLSSPEARARAREHLLSMGRSPESFKPIEWPDDAVLAHRNYEHQPWQFVTRGDIRRRRQREAKVQLDRIREDGAVHRRPLKVVVYYFPGYFTWGCYQGWYTCLSGINFDCYLNWKDRFEEEKIKQLMKLFPVIEPELWCDEDIFERWMKTFVKKYPIRVRRKDMVEVIGTAPVWATFKGRDIVAITGRDQWPRIKK